MKWLAIPLAILLIAAVAVLTANGADEDDARAAAPKAQYTRTCTAFSSPKPFPADKERDAILGRAFIGAFRSNFENAEPGDVYQPEPGKFDLKAPFMFKGRRDITVVVPKDYRAVVRLGYKRSSHRGYSSVRFESCGSFTGYPGGIRYTGPWPACIPLDVTVGSRAATRYVLSLGAGKCPRPE
jgi:hypothetical protein